MAIKKKLILIFIAISIVPMLFIGIFGFVYARNEIEILLIEEFSKLVDLKTKSIEDYLARLEKDIVASAGLSDIQDKTVLLANSPADFTNPIYEKLRGELDKVFNVKYGVGRDLCILILNPQGVIIYEFHKSHHASN